MRAGVPEDDAAGVAALAAAVGAEGTEPLADPLTLLRFYNAQNQDVEAAAEMHREAVAWRGSYSIPELMAEYGLSGLYAEDGGRKGDTAEWTWRRCPSSPKAKLATRHGFFEWLCEEGEDGQPILLWQCGAADYGGYVREGLVDEMTRAWVAHLEDVLQASRAASLRRGEMVRARLVVDAQGFGIGNLRYLSIFKEIIALGKAYFPELTASVTVVRAPWAAAQAYRLVSPLLTALIRRKICILSGSFEKGLLEHAGLERSILPEFLGGSNAESGLVVVPPVPEGAGEALSASE